MTELGLSLHHAGRANQPDLTYTHTAQRVAMTGTSTTATFTRTSYQAPQTTTSIVSSLLTAVLAGLILVTPIWPVSELDAGGVTPISFKLTNTHINSVEEVNSAH